MKTYEVLYNETTAHRYHVKTNSLEEAEQIANKAYYQGEDNEQIVATKSEPLDNELIWVEEPRQ